MRKKDIALALLSGILLILSFPPFDFYYLAWVALIPLLMALLEKSTRASFILGTTTGFIYFTGTVYWVFNSMYFFGNIPAFVSFLLMIGLCLYMGIYIGIFSMFFSFLTGRSRVPALLLVPVIWVTLEFLRSYALTGFPWSSLGYSQYKFLTIIQIADITGIYGISFMVAAVNGAFFDVFDYWPKRLRKMPLFDRWPIAVGLIILAFSFLASMIYGMWRLNTEEKGQKIKVSVIQGNFEQDKKWDIDFKRNIADTYKRLSMEVSAKSPDLIVWPESAIPFIYEKEKALTEEVRAFQKTLDSHLLFGTMMVRELKEGKHTLSNGTILMSPEADVMYEYDKIHLVPFGEYVPLRSILPFVRKLTAGIGDFKAGKEYTVMDMPGARVSTPVCYEIIFPGLVRKFANNGANLIVTVTNDAWFGRSSAPSQHFSMAVFRAIENRTPVARAANTGVSGFIDAKGRIKKKSDIFVETVLTEELTVGAYNKSFYTRYGDLFTFSCIISFILLIAKFIYPSRRN